MKKLMTAGVATAILALIIVLSVANLVRLTESHVNVKVNKSFVKADEYLVYTDVDTYKFDDSLAYLRFFPDEDWGRVKENSCYDFKTVGFRIKLPYVGINHYQNVIQAKEINCITSNLQN